VSGELLNKGSLKAHILGYLWRKNDLSQSDDWLFGVWVGDWNEWQVKWGKWKVNCQNWQVK
jgi:hypothetical protein